MRHSRSIACLLSLPSRASMRVSLCSPHILCHFIAGCSISATVLTYVAVSATEMGLPGDFAFYFVSFANAASLFGRYTAGMLADGIGILSTRPRVSRAHNSLPYRSHERDDTLYGGSWHFNIRLALRK